MDSAKAVATLYEVDPGFVTFCDTMFGKAADPVEVWQALYGPVGKMMPGSADLMTPTRPVTPANPRRRGVLVPKVTTAAMPNRTPKSSPKAAVKPVTTVPKPAQTPVGKSLDVIWTGEFAKRDADKRQAFGWASVVEVNGEPIIDLQRDVITPTDLEDAAYVYVRKSRVGGTQHQRTADDRPVQAGEMIESFVSTPDKIAKMGLPDDFPVGWWVGFQYHDDDTWDDIKSGRKTGFSIHGRGKRMPVEL